MIFDELCIIDLNTRKIKIPEKKKYLGVENDHNANVLKFRMDNNYDGTDLNEMSIQVNFINAKGEKDAYSVTDVVDDGGSITFSWEVSRKAVAYKGMTMFAVRMVKVDSDGVVIKELNTEETEIYVLKGIAVSEEIHEQYYDLLEQWRKEVFGLSEEALKKVNENAEAIESFKEETNKTLSQYAKTETVNKELAKKSGTDHKHTMDDVTDLSLESYAKKEDYYNKKASDERFLQEHQSLEDYYTKEQSDERFLQEHQSLDDYYTKKQSDQRYIQEHQSLQAYEKTEDVDKKLEAYEKTEDADEKLEKKLSKEDYIRKYAFTGKTGYAINPTIEDSTDDDALSVSIKGKTYQNLIGGKKITFDCNKTLTDYVKTESDDFLKVEIKTNVDTWRMASIPIDLKILKPNTKYTVIFEKCRGVSSVTMTNLAWSATISSSCNITNNMALITTLSDLSTISNQVLYMNMPNSAVDICVSGVKILEGDFTSIAYDKFPKSVTGIQSIGECGELTVKLETKNLVCVEEFTPNSVGWYSSCGDPGAFGDMSWMEHKIWLEEGEYVNLSSIPGTSKNVSSLQFISTDETKLFGMDENSNYPKAIPMSSYYILRGKVLEANKPCYFGDIQIERGKVRTTYQKYGKSSQTIQLSEPLRSLPNGVCDEIIGENIIRRVGKVVIDGTNNWNRVTPTTEPTDYFYTTALNASNATTEKSNYNEICDKLPVTNSWNRGLETIRVIYKYQFVFMPLLSKGFTVETVKDYFTNNPVTAYYELLNPVIEEIEPIQLETYKNITNVSQSDPIPTEINVEYVKDINKVVLDMQLSMAEQLTDLQEQVDTLTLG